MAKGPQKQNVVVREFKAGFRALGLREGKGNDDSQGEREPQQQWLHSLAA